MRCSHLQKALFRSSPSMMFLQEACLWLAEGNYIRLNWVIHMGKCPALCSPFLWLLLHITQLVVQTTQVYYLLVWSEKSKIGLTGLQGVGWAVFLPEAPGEDLFLPFSTSVSVSMLNLLLGLWPSSSYRDLVSQWAHPENPWSTSISTS